MFANFRYDSILLKDILLDERNPRIVTQDRLSSQKEILKYLYEHEDLADFVRKIASEGKNFGAERPYVVKAGAGYTVIEGNTRIAAYKVLAGQLTPPAEHPAPQISEKFRKSLLSVDCSVAPSRDALLPIMANAHFGLGDKSKWGYLGSRKAVYDEWKSGKTITQLSKAFDRTKGQINDLILEYQLYLKALELNWTRHEEAVLLNPAVEFNPPVRFLQTQGHKALIGVSYDKANLKIVFENLEAKRKFKHLIYKLVINPQHGLGATASYDEVFKDYGVKVSAKAKAKKDAGGAKSKGKKGSANPKSGALFSYSVTLNSGLIRQLMKEAGALNCRTYPSAGTFLLRNIIESILKHVIDDQKANPASTQLDLEGSINLCMSNRVSLSKDDKKILKEFHNSHLNYLNLGAHGTVIPNHDRLMAARDCIDLFVKRNV